MISNSMMVLRILAKIFLSILFYKLFNYNSISRGALMVILVTLLLAMIFLWTNIGDRDIHIWTCYILLGIVLFYQLLGYHKSFSGIPYFILFLAIMGCILMRDIIHLAVPTLRERNVPKDGESLQNLISPESPLSTI